LNAKYYSNQFTVYSENRTYKLICLTISNEFSYNEESKILLSNQHKDAGVLNLVVS
jgi:hypothetical protein